MKSKRTIVFTIIFMLGIAVGAFAKKAIDSALYVGKTNKEAAANLLPLAKQQADKGSWENIAVGRVYYLGGMKTEGQQIFDSVTSAKKQAGTDYLRIGRVYVEANEWEKAKVAFDKAMQLEPKDSTILAEVGCWYNIKGDRATAETLFRKSFDIEPGEVWHTANVAASYLGVTPQP